MKYLTRASRSNTGTSVKSLWICGGESVSLPPKSLIPSQWTRVPNDLTTLYEFGIMGMYVYFNPHSYSHLFYKINIHATYKYSSPLYLVIHIQVHKLTQAIMHIYVTLEPQIRPRMRS